MSRGWTQRRVLRAAFVEEWLAKYSSTVQTMSLQLSAEVIAGTCFSSSRILQAKCQHDHCFATVHVQRVRTWMLLL